MEKKRETVGWSPRRKCPFNQTSAKIPLPSPEGNAGHRTDRWTDTGRKKRESEKFIPEYATFSTIRSEGSSDGENWLQLSSYNNNLRY